MIKIESKYCGVINLKGRFDKLEQKVDYFQNETNKKFEQIDKRFEQVDKRFDKIEAELNKVTAITIDNQSRINDIQDTVNRTAGIIDKLYNKIDNSLVISKKNEEELTVLAYRQKNHEDRITDLEEKIAG